jgi:hypothetical protein
MLQIKRVFMGSLAALLIAGSVSPIVAHALPIGSALQLHASEKQNQKLIAVHVYNKGEQLQDVKVDEQTYTVKPHDTVVIKAPSGTAVYAASAGTGHQKGDLLFTVTPDLKGATVSFN